MSPIVKFVKCVLLLGLLSVFMALNDVCLTSSITAVGPLGPPPPVPASYCYGC